MLPISELICSLQQWPGAALNSFFGAQSDQVSCQQPNVLINEVSSVTVPVTEPKDRASQSLLRNRLDPRNTSPEIRRSWCWVEEMTPQAQAWRCPQAGSDQGQRTGNKAPDMSPFSLSPKANMGRNPTCSVSQHTSGPLTPGKSEGLEEIWCLMPRLYHPILETRGHLKTGGHLKRPISQFGCINWTLCQKKACPVCVFDLLEPIEWETNSNVLWLSTQLSHSIS